MTSESTKKQFVDYIMLQSFDDQYVDRKEEKAILEEGIRKGIGVEEGLAILRQVALQKGLALERDAEEKTKEMLERFASNDGKVDKKEFDDALAIFKSATKNKLSESEMKRRLKKMMEDNGWKAKEGGLFGSKWFSQIT